MDHYALSVLQLQREALIAAPTLCFFTGPTGVGKTEIARRLAKLADAPFVKVGLQAKAMHGCVAGSGRLTHDRTFLSCFGELKWAKCMLLHLHGQVEATKFTEVGYHGKDVDSM